MKVLRCSTLLVMCLLLRLMISEAAGQSPEVETVDFWDDVMPGWQRIQNDITRLEGKVRVSKIGPDGGCSKGELHFFYANGQQKLELFLDGMDQAPHVFAKGRKYQFSVTPTSPEPLSADGSRNGYFVSDYKSNREEELGTLLVHRRFTFAPVYFDYETLVGPFERAPDNVVVQGISQIDKHRFDCTGFILYPTSNSRLQFSLVLNRAFDWAIENWKTVAPGYSSQGANVLTRIEGAVIASSGEFAETESAATTRTAFEVTDVRPCALQPESFELQQYGVEPPPMNSSQRPMVRYSIGALFALIAAIAWGFSRI